MPGSAYIPPSRRPMLHAYKYSGADQSLVSKYILGPYWNWLVSLFPTSVAPNTITLSGLVLVFANFLTLLAVDGALHCGTDARIAHAATYASGVEAVKEAVVGQLLRITPLLPRFGLPSSVIQSETAWGFTDLFRKTEGPGSHCIPSWVYYTWAICLFAYQSLDAIDGKQARRTGMAGPLGEMFDHGCDALNTTLECLLCASALNLGRSYWTVASLVATLSNFYLTTWEEFHTGTLFLSAFSGPVEGILMICGIYLLTAVMGGPQFWDRGVLDVMRLSGSEVVRKSFLKGWNIPLNDAFAAFAAVGLLANVAASYSNVAAARRKRNQSALTPVLGLLPLLIQLSANVFWMNGQNARIIADGKAFLPFCCFWGLSFAYNVGLLIVAHVTKAPFPYWNVALIWSVLGAVDANLASPFIQTSQATTRVAVYISVAAAFAVYAHFCYDVITTITTELGTACFYVRPPKKLDKELEKKAEAQHEREQGTSSNKQA